MTTSTARTLARSVHRAQCRERGCANAPYRLTTSAARNTTGRHASIHHAGARSKLGSSSVVIPARVEELSRFVRVGFEKTPHPPSPRYTRLRRPLPAGAGARCFALALG